MNALIGSLIGIFATGLIGIITYAWQERVKRKNAMDDQRLKLYDVLLYSLVKLLSAEPGIERSKLVAELERSWLFASDEVLTACYTYMDVYNQLTLAHEGRLPEVLRSDQETRRKVSEKLAEVFWAMRRELKKTDIAKSWANEHIQIYQWGIIAGGK